jgi:hypothetical protein
LFSANSKSFRADLISALRTNSSNENTFLEREQNESIADLITEGTIFAVLCDDKGHDFYLLKATPESIILQENFTGQVYDTRLSNSTG